MKKVFYLVILVCVMSSFLQAQKVVRGSLDALLNESIIGVEVNFHSILGMTEEEYAKYEENYNETKPKLIGYIISNANIEKSRLIFTNDLTKTKTKLVLDIFNVSSKGNITSVATIFDEKGNEIAYITGVYGEGGAFGTKLHLIGDGSKSTGWVIGYFLNNQLRKIEKAKNKKK